MTGNHIIPLSFENQSVRIVDQEGNPWFIAADVCAALGIQNPTQATAKLEADERSMISIGRQGDTIVLSEAGVYTVALRCRDAMKPGTKPYKFRKWVTGTALPAIRRGHEDYAVHLTQQDRSAIGGILKGVVAKQLNEILPALIDGRLLETQASVSHGVTAGEVIQLAGVENRKGLRGLPRRVSDQLRRFCAEKGVAVKIGRLGSNSAYVFDLSAVREWLAEGGKGFILRLIEEKRGQGALKLITN